MSNVNDIRSSIILDISTNDEGKEILTENYILKEKLENLQKVYDNEKFKNVEKIKELENKVSHLTISLDNANETIEVLKNVDNKEDRQIKEMIEKMRKKINELESFNSLIKKENADFVNQIEKLKFDNQIKERNQEIYAKENIEEGFGNNNDGINIKKKSNDTDSIGSGDSEMSFSKKTPEELKAFFKGLKNDKDTFYDNAVNIITENEIEIETFKNSIEDYRNLIRIYDVKYNLLKKLLKKKFNVDLPNLEDFEEDMIKEEYDSIVIGEYNSHFFENLKITPKNRNDDIKDSEVNCSTEKQNFTNEFSLEKSKFSTENVKVNLNEELRHINRWI